MQRKCLFGFGLFFMFLVACRGEVNFIPLNDVQPGMTGTGRTCMVGKEVIPFDFEVLGILRNTSPGHSLVLIRITSPAIERTGVFAGMSGSPVYIGDRLLGAAAFSFPFSTEPVAGVTPFEEMRSLARHEAATLPVDGIEILPSGFDMRRLSEYLRRDLPLAPEEWPFLPDRAVTAAGSIRPIRTPLVMRGASSRALEQFRDLFGEYGFTAVSGGQSGQGPAAGQAPALIPGQGLVVNLVEGDLELGASGTVTAVDGDKVYAFGHRFFEMGTTSVPIYDSETITVVPNLNNSFKFATTGPRVGAITQDRAVGVYGTLGQAPDMIPVSLSLTGSAARPQQYKLNIMRDPVLTGFLLNFSLFSFLTSDERPLGQTTVEAEATITLKDGTTIDVRNIFSHPLNASTQAAQFISLPLQYLMMSGFPDLEPVDIQVSFRIWEKMSTARLDEVWISKDRVRPGESLEFTLNLFREDGTTTTESFTITIPEDMAPGPLHFFIGDGVELSKLDQKLEPGLFNLFNSRQLIRALKQLRQNGTIYVKLYRKGEGIYAKGNHLPALPPSVLEIFKNERSQGGSMPIQYIHYMEKSLGDRNYVVTGSNEFQVMVESF
jgi:hypothetical protein